MVNDSGHSEGTICLVKGELVPRGCFPVWTDKQAPLNS